MVVRVKLQSYSPVYVRSESSNASHLLVLSTILKPPHKPFMT